jgi:hypothetical protein
VMTSDDAPTHDERLDFLRQAIAFAEWTIRSLDTRAQIGIVAFALSLSPLWTMLTAACPRAASSLIVAILLPLFAACISMLVLVILPFGAIPSKTAAWPTKGLVYVRNASQITGSVNTDRLLEITSEADLIEETLNLARIRETKSRRLKHAMRAVLVFYVWAVVAFLLLRNC